MTVRRINALRFGVETRDKVLFTDFQDSGEMWTGRGTRKRITTIRYKAGFVFPPAVQISMSMLDVHHATNTRYDVSAINITPVDFQVLFQTWGDTRIARAKITWTAFGELPVEIDEMEHWKV